MDRQDQVARLRVDIAGADAQFERNEHYEDGPDFWASVIEESDRMERDGIAPDPDVCP